MAFPNYLEVANRARYVYAIDIPIPRKINAKYKKVYKKYTKECQC